MRRCRRTRRRELDEGRIIDIPARREKTDEGRPKGD